jgi:hypothetical protein
MYSFLVSNGLTTETIPGKLILIEFWNFYDIYEFTDVAESIFQVTYKVERFDLIIDDYLELGPITNQSTLDDLSTMVSIINKDFILHFLFLRWKQQYPTIQISLFSYLMLLLILMMELIQQSLNLFLCFFFL